MVAVLPLEVAAAAAVPLQRISLLLFLLLVSLAQQGCGFVNISLVLWGAMLMLLWGLLSHWKCMLYNQNVAFYHHKIVKMWVVSYVVSPVCKPRKGVMLFSCTVLQSI